MTILSKPTQVAPKTSSQALQVILLSVLAGFLISTFWSAEFVDDQVGQAWSNSILGIDAREVAITSVGFGLIHALVTGFAGAFTACNICAFSAIAPLAAEKRTVGKLLKPIFHLAAGMIVVASLYGAIGALLGPGHLQLNETRLGDPETGIRVRSIQSMGVFVSIGAIYVVWGLMSLDVVRNPFANVAMLYPWARSVFMGATIGAFLIGRPFGLFRHMFSWAVETRNPLLGATAFTLQSVGNIVIMLALFLFLVYGTGGRFERWLHAKPNRIKTVTAAALIIGGTFFMLYWGPRLLARNDLFVWPYYDWEMRSLLFSRPPG